MRLPIKHLQEKTIDLCCLDRAVSVAHRSGLPYWEVRSQVTESIIAQVRAIDNSAAVLPGVVSLLD